MNTNQLFLPRTPKLKSKWFLKNPQPTHGYGHFIVVRQAWHNVLWNAESVLFGICKDDFCYFVIYLAEAKGNILDVFVIWADQDFLRFQSDIGVRWVSCCF